MAYVRDMHTKVVGTTMGEGENRQETISKLNEGDVLYAVHEEDNPFDSNAIKLYADAEKQKPVGYVSRDLAKDIVTGMHRGWTYSYKVKQATGGGRAKAWGLNICITAISG